MYRINFFVRFPFCWEFYFDFKNRWYFDWGEYRINETHVLCTRIARTSIHLGIFDGHTTVNLKCGQYSNITPKQKTRNVNRLLNGSDVSDPCHFMLIWWRLIEMNAVHKYKLNRFIDSNFLRILRFAKLNVHKFTVNIYLKLKTFLRPVPMIYMYLYASNQFILMTLISLIVCRKHSYCGWFNRNTATGHGHKIQRNRLKDMKNSNSCSIYICCI